MTITVYGISNCDTIKKARKWLEGQGINYAFHDYKKSGVPADKLADWVILESWETILNRGGTTFRKLDEMVRNNLDSDRAVMLMREHPSMIKRPIVEYDDGLLVGFHGPTWAAALTDS